MICKDCKQRTAECHAKCGAYLKYRAEKDAIREQKIKNCKLNDYQANNRVKPTRRKKDEQ